MADTNSTAKKRSATATTEPKKRGRPKTRAKPRSTSAAEHTGEVLKPRFTRPDVSERRSVHTEPGDNRKYLMHALSMFDWPKPDMTNYDAVYERIMDYFALCEDRDMKPNVEGLAVAFGVTRRTIWNWTHEVESKFIPDNVRDILLRATTIMNAMMSDYMMNGKINPVSGIFLMKNNYDYADQSQLVVQTPTPLGTDPNERDLQAKLMDGTIVELPEDSYDIMEADDDP